MATHRTPPSMQAGSLAGHLLIATPVVQDSFFARSVVYLCAHNAEGAMGVIVNYPVEAVGIKEVFEQLNLTDIGNAGAIKVHFGGPVETGRGFVIHSADYRGEGTLIEKDGIAVTSNVAILQALAAGKGPVSGLLALGYSGWSSGQLEAEIESGSWIVVPATAQLVLNTDNDTKWNVALSTLGIDMGHFSTVVGHA